MAQGHSRNETRPWRWPARVINGPTSRIDQLNLAGARRALHSSESSGRGLRARRAASPSRRRLGRESAAATGARENFIAREKSRLRLGHGGG